MIRDLPVFGLTVETYSLMAVLAAAAFAALSWRRLRRCGLSASGAVILLFLISVFFLFGARLWNIAVNPDSYNETRPWYTLRMTGFSVFGGITGVAVVVLSAALPCN